MTTLGGCRAASFPELRVRLAHSDRGVGDTRAHAHAEPVCTTSSFSAIRFNTELPKLERPSAERSGVNAVLPMPGQALPLQRKRGQAPRDSNGNSCRFEGWSFVAWATQDFVVDRLERAIVRVLGRA